MIGPIALEGSEQELAVQVFQNRPTISDVDHYERTVVAGKRAHVLFRTLMKRGAIPESRLRYFADPEYNVGSRYSKAQRFKQNVGSDEEMYAHPHFIPYLHYFIYGPDLPPSFQEEFHELTQASFRDWDALMKLARNQARRVGGKNGAEEFYKLAIDAG